MPAPLINGKAIPPGWPPDNSVNSSQYAGMNPEAARTAAWISYTNRQTNGPGNFTQGAAGIDPATGKPLPAPTSGQSIAQSVAQSSMGPNLSDTQGQNMATFYNPAAPIQSTGGGGGSLQDYLNQKLGPEGRYSVTTPINPQGAGGGYTQIVGKGGGGGDLGSIMAAIKAAQDKANAANEGRYAQANAYLSKYGKSYKADINDAYNQDVGKTEQEAVSRGIGNTTIRNSLLQGVAKTRNNALLNLNDRLAQQRVNLLQSKTDQGPDPMAFAGLLQNAAQGAYGSGGSLSSIAAALGLLR